MRRLHLALTVLWIASALGCGSRTGQKTEDSRDAAALRIAGGADTEVPKAGPKPYDGPPHIFTPSSHAPRYRYRDAETPDLSSLPALQIRFDQCFAPKRERRPVPIASSPKPTVKGKKKKGGARKSQATRSSKSRKPSGRSAGSMEDLLGAVSGAGGGSLSTGAPLPPPAVKSEAAAPGAPPPPEPAEAAPEAPMVMSQPSLKESEKRIAVDDADDEAMIAEEEAEPEPDVRDQYDDWGAAIYLSNDDTMSLSSAQRVIYAIDNFLPLPAEHIRPHELLNYFSFDTGEVADGMDFSVVGDIAPDPREEGIHTLALAVRGRPVDKISRRNAAITFVIDRSGSMQDEGRMSYLKRGLLRMIDELKTGDIVHLVLFDHELCVPAENFVVGRDDIAKLKKTIEALTPRGSTDLHLGLSKGYDIAKSSYQKSYSNRVVMITDALANTGVTDEQMISMISKYYDTRRIRLSGVGVGRDFNDSLLDRLTERGKGAYVFLGSEAEVDAVFGSRFISLIETTALDVHFRLHLPPSLRMNVFYGEESSTVKEDVQEIHYFANTSQLFLSDLMARGGALRPEDSVMLSIEYKDPETEEDLKEEYAFNLGVLQENTRNVHKARVIMAWIDMLAEMAARPVPGGSYTHRRSPGSWQDPEGWRKCEEGRRELDRLAEKVAEDGEIKRVKELFEKYCARYERPRQPVKRKIAAPDDSWPGASGR